MDRRRFILSTAGAGLAVAGLAAPTLALAATDDELAYASFGQAAELLLEDFYKKAQAAKAVLGSAAKELARGELNAGEHQAALAKLLTDAGQTASLAEDFEFVWPERGFASAKSISDLGSKVTQPLLGVYLGAAATISILSYRTLFAAMAANLAQQVGALQSMSGGRIVGVSFPPAIDVETASDAIEAYLG
jgi:hypothetical protein